MTPGLRRPCSLFMVVILVGFVDDDIGRPVRIADAVYRTPITNLKTQTEVALSQARSVEQYREVLYSNLEEYERMAKMLGDMLFLAQADNNLLKPELVRIDLQAEVRVLVDYFVLGPRSMRWA